jgi:hypothetical protein
MAKNDPKATRNDNPIAQRQRALAQRIGMQFRDTAKLIPLDYPGEFSLGLPLHDLTPWYDEPICQLVWQVVARRLEDIHHVIDHAWLFGFRDPPHEPWGFVTEPYLDADPQQVVEAATAAMDGWGVAFHWLPKDASAWNPGRCTPIIAISEHGWLDTLMRGTLRWWLAEGL